MNSVHFVVPEGIDDPARPSGGNGYDRRVCRELTALGWQVREHPVKGAWPDADELAVRSLAHAIADIPDRATVLVDGLIGSAVPGVLAPQSQRLRLAVLVHRPFENEDERAVLTAASAVIATSEWTRARLLERYRLPAHNVHVAVPGADPADIAPGTAGGGELLCVAAVAAHKGHDVLAAAMGRVAELPWSCTCIGSLERDPAFVATLRRTLAVQGISERVSLRGPRTGDALERAYARADVLVLASRGETYGMVVSEALAHGLPVIATAVGGVREAVGAAPDAAVPGLLVPGEDVDALAGALRSWLEDAALRSRLRRAARDRRHTLPTWSMTARRLAEALPR